MRGILLTALGLVAVAFSASHAFAETRVYTIAVGSNQPPQDSAEAVPPLRYADDDAAAFFRYARGFSAHAEVLAILDADSQRRFPELGPLARAPSWAQLSQVVAEFRMEMLADLARGDRPVLLFFYSGHGVGQRADRAAALSLFDGDLTQQRLYDDVLAALPARAAHLLIDACHAADVVRPRDLEAKVVEVSNGDLHRLIEATTLARFPHVGALMAASVTGETHEWDGYRQGVFTYQLISALRGAADVNTDGVIEYSEVVSFLSSANRDVTDARARLQVVARPPAIDRRLPIVDLTWLKSTSRLRSRRGTPEHFFVEDAQGNRLVEMRSEAGFRFDLRLPVGETLYVVSSAGTAELWSGPGTATAIEDLSFQPAHVRTRGAMTAALRRGLFAGSFGPSYYQGFVDSSPDLVSVGFVRAPDPSPDVDPGPLVGRPAIAALAGAGLLAATSLTFAVLTQNARSDFEGTPYQAPAQAAADRYYRDRRIAVISGLAAVAVSGLASWLIWHRRHARHSDGHDAPPSVAGDGLASPW